jgi:predicted AAA+ superfamily ATPase
MELEKLIEQNPWWREPANIQTDNKIREALDSKYTWEPRMIAFIGLDRDVIYTLRGPRQVGKTTFVKFIIEKLLLGRAIGVYKPIDPRAIFYFTCDLIASPKELVEVIEVYLDFSNRIKSDQRRYLFIDEISSVKGWEASIKHLSDTGKLQNMMVLLTGSHALDLKKSTERLPGRRGGKNESLNKILMPMKFSEFIETTNPELAEDLRDIFPLSTSERFEMLFNLFKGTIDPTLETDYPLYAKETRVMFDHYLQTGGIMRAINSYFTKGSIDNNTYEIYIQWLLGDLRKWNFDENIIRQVLRAVVTRIGTRISSNSIYKETEIGSHHTVTRYLEGLENSFVLNLFYQSDLHKKQVNYGKEKKAYFSDPFIYHAVKGWTDGSQNYFNSSQDVIANPESKSKLVEMLVSNHVVRIAYNIAPSDVFNHHERTFFWKKSGKKDKEIDFIIKKDDEYFPLEVKYQTKITRRDLGNLFSLKKGVLLSKQHTESYKSYAILPVEAFLLMI